MTTRTEHRAERRTEHSTTTKERSGELLGEKRAEQTGVTFSKIESVRKPLPAFDALPTRTAPPLTWD
jgi:hypothetical protein